MSIFDFFKSEEQKERERVFQKLMDDIFPSGRKQIDEEVREVRELLDFRYSKDDTHKTYVHAASIFHIADDKCEDRIVKSILLNENSVVTKSDAKLIHEFLKKKYMNSASGKLVNLIKSMEKEQQLLMVAKGGIVELKNSYTKEQLTTGGRFEALLFNSLLILNEILQNTGNQSDELKDKYFEALIMSGVHEYKVTKNLDLVVKFINSRMTFYSEELNKLTQHDNYTPMKIHSAFFKKQLQFNVEIEEPPNLIELLEFYQGLTQMMNWVTDNVKKYLHS